MLRRRGRFGGVVLTDRALALVNAEMEQVFDTRGTPSSSTGMRAFAPGFRAGGGFVRAGGEQSYTEVELNIGGAAPYVPAGPAATQMPIPNHPMPPMPPKGPAAMGYARVRFTADQADISLFDPFHGPRHLLQVHRSQKVNAQWTPSSTRSRGRCLLLRELTEGISK